MFVRSDADGADRYRLVGSPSRSDVGAVQDVCGGVLHASLEHLDGNTLTVQRRHGATRLAQRAALCASDLPWAGQGRIVGRRCSAACHGRQAPGFTEESGSKAR